jgi:hypothetical protein
VVKAYVLIQSEPGKAVQVVGDVLQVGGVTSAEGVTGPYATSSRWPRRATWTSSVGE